MQQCKNIGCHNPVSEITDDFCSDCSFGISQSKKAYEGRPAFFDEKQSTKSDVSSGGDNDYWLLTIHQPKRLESYQVECEDIIEALQMTFQEGEAFKALWRKGMIRLGNGKPGDSPLRNAEKVQHFGNRMVAMEQRALQQEHQCSKH